MREKLSHFHTTILIFMIQSGMGIFFLPRLLAEQFGTNGWLGILLFFLVSTFNIVLIAIVYRIGNGSSIFDIMAHSLPKVVLYPLYTIFVAIWSITGCLIAKHYIVVFQMIAYPTTNPILFKFVIDVLLFFLVIKELYNISKAATIFFWLTIPLLILLLYFYKDFEFGRLTPFLFKDNHMSAQGLTDIYFSYPGYELGLLLFPYVNKKTKLIKSLVISNSMLTFVYLYTCFIAFGFYGYKYLRTLQYPLLNILAYIQLPFVQGTENLFYGFFLFSILITSVMYLWAARETVEAIIPIPQKLISLLLVMAVFGISIIPDTLIEVIEWTRYAGYMTMGVAFVLPVLLIILLLIQRMRGDNHDYA